MGARAGYLAYFESHPGTYFRSSGWIERETSCLTNSESTTSQMGITTYENYVKKYGEENAKFLMQALSPMQHYTRLAFIDTQVGETRRYKEEVKRIADEKGWTYDDVPGSVDLLLRMTNGEWDDCDFLVVPSGQTIAPSGDEGIIKAVPDVV